MTRINNSVNNISGSLTTTKIISGYCLPISKYYTSTMSVSAQNLTTINSLITSLTLPLQGTYEITANIVEDLSSITATSSACSSIFKIYSDGNYVVNTSPQTGAVLSMSSDGSKIIHGAHTDVATGPIYISNDSGATWQYVSSAGLGWWNAICCSDDGNVIAACDFQGYIHVSRDGGITWTIGISATTDSWSSIACSSDGTKMIACASSAQYGYVWTSTDSGANWTRRNAIGAKNWTGVCCSYDGLKMYAAASADTVIHKTIDYGVNWTSPDPYFSISSDWVSIACDYTGSKIILIKDTTTCKSIDSGLNWTYPAVGLSHYNSMIMSKDGINTFFYRAGASDTIYKSQTDGATFSAVSALGSAIWATQACSYNGNILSACVYQSNAKTYTNMVARVNTEKMGTQLSKIITPIFSNNKKTNSFSWIINNSINNNKISIYGKINNITTGYWKVIQNTNMFARLIS